MMKIKLLIAILFCTLSITELIAKGNNIPPREKLLLDYGWKFHYGDLEDMYVPLAKSRSYANTAADVDFDDSAWRSVDLPHDFVIENPKDSTARSIYGAYPTNIGIYRRSFDVESSDKGKLIWVQFDGIYRNAEIYLNGFFVGKSTGGYTPCRFEISQFLNYGGENAMLVKTDARVHESWWYDGGGIYRHAWILKTNPAYIEHDGVFVKTNVAEDNKKAMINVETNIVNTTEKKINAKLISKIVDKNNNVAVHNETSFIVNGTRFKAGTPIEKNIAQSIELNAPLLWSPDSPNLYKIISELWIDDKLDDVKETAFGVRTIRFDAAEGFFLNGKPLKIKGVCVHQDHACVGVAVPDEVQYFRIKKLKEMGVNAYRCAHYPHSPEIMRACDELGMMVMDETRLLVPSEEYEEQLKRLILRDRNHPSVILWSIGNEEGELQGGECGYNFGQRYKSIIDELDGTRPITIAMNGGFFSEGVKDVVDVVGFNYNNQQLIDFAKLNRPVIASESASSTTTRGIYKKDPVKTYLNAYDKLDVSWGNTIEEALTTAMTHKHIGGTFMWTGFDYRGEPTPYGNWPATSSHFGILDLCGFPKDVFYYVQSWWSEKEVLHILPHWNWEEEGKPVEVWIYSNADEVELFLKGRSLGRKKMKKYGHLEWMVPYQAGTLQAKSYRDGKIVKTRTIETTGKPYAVVVTTEKPLIKANNEDIAILTVTVVDNKGRIVPDATNQLEFSVDGPGRIIGVGNGDPATAESDKLPQIKAFSGYAQVLVRAKDVAGTIRFTAKSEGLNDGKINIQSEKAEMRPYIKTKVSISDKMFKRAKLTTKSGIKAGGYDNVKELYEKTAGHEGGVLE